MLISKVYVRFYRSFNFDYLRKTHPKAKPSPWDCIEPDLFYPFVQIPIEKGITTVVGGNEAGKSQLLIAIKAGLTGHQIRRSDFCRYSQFFTVGAAMRLPDFGLELTDFSEEEVASIRRLANAETTVTIERAALFRFAANAPVLYLPSGDTWEKYEISNTAELEALLPRAFEIDAEVPLPNSVPIKTLASGGTERRPWWREQRFNIEEAIGTGNAVAYDESFAQSLKNIFVEPASAYTSQSEALQTKMLRLADDLLIRVARVSRTAFGELYEAVKRGDEGFANGIVARINADLEKALNFRKFWSQDHHFALRVSLREFDLAFTIRDRTGTEYSFSERSGGLKYFLSYFVQYLSHQHPADGTQEILLMDEPDAYLSSSGQQDLLKIFDAFAYPSNERPSCQVVYVTHSPFLIDKNHGERIRVLEKGENDEGTRVVRNASQNHYEPLRSAFGSFVAETTFISNCNLMLEGPSDQVLIAGISTLQRRAGAPQTQTIDLNCVTLVPAGSAEQVPYMVYLARGRDVERPATVVLLDSDVDGDKARATLKKGGPKNKRLIDDQYVLQIGEVSDLQSDRPGGAVVIEDLVPVAVAVAAAKRYVSEYLGDESLNLVASLGPKQVKVGDDGLLAALLVAIGKVLGDEFHLDKVGFARNVVAVLEDPPADLSADLEVVGGNFRKLFGDLGRRQRAAMRELAIERTSSKIKRLRDGFFRDHPAAASREEGSLLLDDIAEALGSGYDADVLRLQIISIRRDHSIDEDISSPIIDYAAFRDAVASLVYAELRSVQVGDRTD